MKRQIQSLTPGKRRRVLSEIVNMDPVAEAAPRRKSLGFDMVSIELSPKRMRSNIPEAPTTGVKEINSRAEENRKHTQIPTIDFRRLKEIKQSLINKQCVSFSGSEQETRSPLPEEDGIDSQIAKAKLLDEDQRKAAKELEELEYVLLELRRDQKNLQKRLLETELKLRELKQRFTYLEHHFMDDVLHKEKMINLKLQEYSNQLQDQYNDTKFELENEMLKNRDFDDTAAVNEIQELKEKRDKLLVSLEETISKKTDSLNRELVEIQLQLDETLTEKKQEVENALSRYQETQNELDLINNELDNMVQEKNLLETSKRELQQQTKEVADNTENFASIKLRLETELTIVNDELRSFQSEDLDWQKKISDEKDVYQQAKHKHDKYSSSRRILENAIMDYEGTVRVYVRVDQRLIENDRELLVNTKSYRFSKVCDISRLGFSREWQLLVEKVLTTNVALVFSGTSHYDINDLLLDAYTYLSHAGSRTKNWSFKYYLQSVCVEGDEITDLLNLSTENSIEFSDGKLVEVISQKMLVGSTNDLTSVLRNIRSSKKVLVHLLTVDGNESVLLRSSSRTLLIMNVSGLSVEMQSEILQQKSDSSHINNLTHHAINHCKCLRVVNVVDPSNAVTLLDTVGDF